MKTSISVIYVFLLIQSCQNSNFSSNDTIPDNSQTSIDWPGTYYGIVPCTDCEGIETTITLNRDLTYSANTIYRGKGGQVFSRTGQFTWNEDGSTILLGGMFDGPSQYQVGENVLIQLDLTGKRITGNLAEQYRLIRTEESNLYRARWNLIELLGKSFDRSTAYINFDMEKNRMSGYGWCNTFNSSFELLPGNHIRFNELTATNHMCLDTTAETQLLNMFKAVDSYQLAGNTLILSRGKVAPMAKFEGVKNVGGEKVRQ